MNRFVLSMFIVLIMVAPGTVMAQSLGFDSGFSEAESLEISEGRIEKITETMIVVNDTGLIFPNTLSPTSESGDSLPRSSLQVGDKVFYTINADRVLLFIGKFGSQ